jgi:hypothetical protein
METFKNNKCNIKTMATKKGMERHVYDLLLDVKAVD